MSNSGNLALHWKADVGSASWVTLDTSSQTIAPGSFPDAINVTVDTTNLSAGNQSATLTVNSNGGTVQVAITLAVNQPAQPPPTQPCTLQAPSSSNTTFTANYGSNPKAQTFTIGVSGACSAGVTITESTQRKCAGVVGRRTSAASAATRGGGEAADALGRLRWRDAHFAKGQSDSQRNSRPCRFRADARALIALVRRYSMISSVAR